MIHLPHALPPPNRPPVGRALSTLALALAAIGPAWAAGPVSSGTVSGPLPRALTPAAVETKAAEASVPTTAATTAATTASPRRASVAAARSAPAANPFAPLPALPAGQPVQLAAATASVSDLDAPTPAASPNRPRRTARAATAPVTGSAAPVDAEGGALAAAPNWRDGNAPTAAGAPPRSLAQAPSVPARPGVEQRFDLSINNAPAQQVFLQLAQGSPYNMLVAPDVAGQLSITLKDTTVPEAMETMRELFGYEYRITGNRIFVYSNSVQTRLYRVNYLPGRRQGTSDLRVTSSAITGSGGSHNGASSSSSGQAGGGSGGARIEETAKVSTTSDSDFWRDVQRSLDSMVGGPGRSVVLNPAAGVVVVRANPSELRQVENYLKAVQLSIERQVMLEAKIVEVVLSNDAQAGINWAGFGSLGKGKITIGNAAPGTQLGPTGNLISGQTSVLPGAEAVASAIGKGFYGLAFQAANFAALLNFLQTQGDVQVLSSPRIATLNNQKAVLKVGTDELYVTGLQTNTTTSTTGQTSSPTVILQPFFSGISLDVTPQIDDVGNVMLHVHPSISTVTERSKTIELGSGGTVNMMKLPLAMSEVNETDSIVRVKDGQIVAIGGLMKEVVQSEKSGLPLLQDAPLVGGLFRQTSKVRSKRELVILLKPTVIAEAGSNWPEPTPAAKAALEAEQANLAARQLPAH